MEEPYEVPHRRTYSAEAIAASQFSTWTDTSRLPTSLYLQAPIASPSILKRIAYTLLNRKKMERPVARMAVYELVLTPGSPLK